MHSRLLPAPWPPQRGLARRGNGPCSILTRRPSAVAGPATARLPGSHWEGWCAVAGPACSSSKLPPIQESRQRPPPRCYRLAAAPTQRCVWPAALMITCAQAQLIMLLAALHQTSDTFLHSPHDALPSSIPRTPASLRHPVATFIPKCVHLVINGTLLIPPWCSILSFVRPSPPPCQTWSVRSEAPTWALPTFQALFHAQEEQHAFPRLSRRLPAQVIPLHSRCRVPPFSRPPSSSPAPAHQPYPQHPYDPPRHRASPVLVAAPPRRAPLPPSPRPHHSRSVLHYPPPPH